MERRTNMELGEYLDERFNMEEYYFGKPEKTVNPAISFITYYLFQKSDHLEVGYIDIISESHSIDVRVILAADIMTEHPSLLNDLRQLAKTFYFEKSKERIRLTNGAKQFFFT